MKPRFAYVFGAVPLVVLMAAPAPAQAALESCGGVFLSGNAQCEFRRTQDCEEHCEVVSVEESCAANLYTSCKTECTAEASTECTQTCSPVCVQECTVTEGESSADICRGNCLSDCDAKCATAQNPACCRRACPHTCNRRCEERCRDDDQQVECTPKCATACEGTCVSTLDTTCQVDCQTIQWESCQTTEREECRTDCTDKGGAIFCDGQFIHAANLEDCAAELSSFLAISLDVSVDVDVDTHVDTDGDGSTEKVSCAISAPTAARSGMFWWTALLAGAALARCRRMLGARRPR